MTHVEFMLLKFKENKLYANWAKNKFVILEMDFLGHVLSWEGARLDPKTIESIKEWQSPNLTKGVRSFLGLPKFYKKVHKGLFSISKTTH